MEKPAPTGRSATPRDQATRRLHRNHRPQINGGGSGLSDPLADLVIDTPPPDAGPSRLLTLAEVTTPLTGVRLALAAPFLTRAPRGDGHVVVDVPGWKAPEASGWPIRTFLRSLGYDARSWGLGTNQGDVRTDVGRLHAQVVNLAERHGPVSLVGWSLGGVLSREVARRSPDAVRRVVTYGTPVVGGPAYTFVASRYDASAKEQAERAAHDEVPISVPVTAMFSRRDGIVAWRACLDRTSPHVDHVEIGSPHLAMGIDPAVWRVVADRLARPV
ncbi:hypothetical protein KLP28_10440 [Nocardioidaceae bacterium]|nr:hypothetical protein KLP28_10440 [Nocardioidaceae bacterium]